MIFRTLGCVAALSTLASLAPAQTAVLDGSAQLAAAFDVTELSLQTLQPFEDETGFVAVPVVLDGELVTLGLERHSVRAPDYELLVDDGSGALVPGPLSAPSTFRGVVLEWPGSRVAASWVDGQLDALVVPAARAGHTFGIQSAAAVDASYAPEQHVVYRSTALLDDGWTCGGAVDDGTFTPRAAPTQGAYAGSYVTCEIACDADFEYYESNNSSVTATENDIENIINRTEVIYEADTQIFYDITTIIVRTSNNDPYSSTSPNSLLNQFDSHWSSQQQGVQRDIAHLFTGKDIDGGVIGIAKLSQICSQNNGYGLSQSKFSSNIISRTALTVHELGHNWSAQHCDGQSDCGIMCSGLGGCTGELQAFGQTPINQILNEKNSSGCLDPASPPPPPAITELDPPSVSALGGETVLIKANSDLLKVNSLSLGGQDIPSGPDTWYIVNDKRILLVAPMAEALGPQDIVLGSTFGDSNSVPLEVEAVDPPVYDGPPLVLVFSSTPGATYTYGTDPSDTCFFILAFDNTLFPYQGHPLLVNLIFLTPLPTNAAGVGQLTLDVPTELSGTLFTWYTQMAFFNGGLQSISPVVSTAAL